MPQAWTRVQAPLLCHLPARSSYRFWGNLLKEQLPNLCICVTDRPEVDIFAILEPLAFRSVSLHDARGQWRIMRDYIESTMLSRMKICKIGVCATSNLLLVFWQEERVECKAFILYRLTALTSTCLVGSDGCISSSNTSRIAP